MIVMTIAAIAAAPAGNWQVEGGVASAPQYLSLQVSGNSLTGTADGVTITDGHVEGAFFWFHVSRNGGNYLYKGQVKQGKLVLQEVVNSTSRTLTYGPA